MLNKIFTFQGSMMLPAFVVSAIVGLYGITNGSQLKIPPYVGWMLFIYSLWILGCMFNSAVNANKNKKAINGK